MISAKAWTKLTNDRKGRVEDANKQSSKVALGVLVGMLVIGFVLFALSRH